MLRRILLFVGLLAGVVGNAANQVDEAATVFDGVSVGKMRGGTWKVVYSSMEGPEARALETLVRRLGPLILREGFASTPMVLPMERDGGEPVKGKRDLIVVGVPARHATLRRYVEPGSVPRGGYVIRTLNDGGRNVVALAGDGPSEVLWATFDFLDVVVPELEPRLAGRPSAGYPGTFFRAGRVPETLRRSAPQTSVRSVFSWGHVIDDCNETFRAMARLRFNRAILWNDQRVLNADRVVADAHSWGVRVYWGFSWGWTLSGSDAEVDFGKLADGIVAEWREKWRPMGGDGIYFQSFTETEKKTIGGKSIPQAVTELVNAVSSRIRVESPKTDIVFGLHSNSMRNPEAAKWIAKVDPTLEILWENCGGFPYWEGEGRIVKPDVAFNDRILALTPSVGLAWKAQLRMDWSHYVPPAGPFLLGCAGERVLARDRAVIAPLLAQYDDDWYLNGRGAYDLIRHIRAGKNQPREFNAVAEYNPPFSFATACQAELFWNSEDSWENIARRARMRACAER